MFYYPSACSNMNSSACLDINYEPCNSKYYLHQGEQYPQQDSQSDFNVNHQIGGVQQWNNAQLENVQAHQKSNSTNTKRRRDSCDEQSAWKKSNIQGINNRNEWPEFQHPEGGVIQFTPHGNVRTFYDYHRNVQVSKLENEASFTNFARG